ncbi:MAG: 4'-phosphopantetheinyl transferase superfamily protein [Bacteroidales bacterium]|nr:4'-phosphopantetheinyl transferase superfamily protein [Bacteroidales bacterium]MBR4506555.1 4'-phosphopantetheinyl transferase superfamily protein [Bacteroidales bacterium]
MISSAKPDLQWAIDAGEWRTHKEQSEAARRLLCRLLDRDVAIEHDDLGAPYLPDSPSLHISISHCRRAVAVAVSANYRIGIDVESRRKVSSSLMERVCNADELSAIRSSDDSTMTFLRFWTRKEAVLKMRGTGIRGFGSMVDAAVANDCTIEEIDCGIVDTVAAVARAV